MSLVDRAIISAPYGFWLAAHLAKGRKGPVSDQELADHLGIKRETVWKWKLGKAEPDIQTRGRIAKFLEITERELWRPPGFIDLNAAAEHIKDEKQREKLAQFLKDYPSS